MTGLATYRRTIPAGRSQTIGARGVAIILRNVTGEVTVTARAAQVGEAGGEAYSNIMRKDEKWFLPSEFDSVEVYNGQESAVEVEFLIGYGDFVREVTSRAQAARFVVTHRVEADSAGAGNLPAVALLPENPRRKRAFVRLVQLTPVS